MLGGVAQSWSVVQGFLTAAQATPAKQVTAQFIERKKIKSTAGLGLELRRQQKGRREARFTLAVAPGRAEMCPFTGQIPRCPRTSKSTCAMG